MSHPARPRWKIGVRLAILALGSLAVLTPSAEGGGDPFRVAGDALTLALPAAAAAATAGLADGEGALELGESLATTLGVTYGLKHVIRERRPSGEDRDSFPSGHASVSFSSAEFLRKRYGWKYGLPAYALAAFVGYSRVESKQHHAHDVLAGAVIGTASGFLFTRPFERWTVALEGDARSGAIRAGLAW